jgi:outer membrane protein assembly factor BamD
MYFKRNIFVIALSLLLAGCASTQEEEITNFNKPALYWYKAIAKSISNSNMDKADEHYISLKSEHMSSPLMSNAIMILAHAHMNKEEYLLANYYLDEYNKRFGDGRGREYADFMKLKASFLGIKDVYKDQKLIMDSIGNANSFLIRYPDSAYAPLVNTILIRLQMSQYLLNENIAILYERTGKPDAAKIYREKNSNSVVEMSDIKPPKKGIIGKIFN